MSYQALYRKWRPVDFDGVCGQPAAVAALRNQVLSGRIGHAYLFCGTRGTGKTSVAKIFSRAVNCPHAAEHGGSPCNECEVCRSILTESSMNVFEIDAASNNGVDNIRDIREQVEYPPTAGRYKVYIIDEVHMLSAGAFNALLKTLEEPPEYVIFILATTDPQKIPQTILSRCQRYDFRRMTRQVIRTHMMELAKAEGLDIEERALDHIAALGDGSMRDSLSLLDQCLAFSGGGRLTYADALKILGIEDNEVFSGLYQDILNGRAENALTAVAKSLADGKDVTQLVSDLVWYLRGVLLSGGLESSAEILDVSEEELSLYRRDYASAGRDRLMQVLTSLAELLNRMRSSSQKRVLFEVELIRLSLGGGAAADPVRAAGQLAAEGPVYVSPRISIPAAPVSAPAPEEAPVRQDAPAGTPESAERARIAAAQAVDAMRRKNAQPKEEPAAPAVREAPAAAPQKEVSPRPLKEAEEEDILALVRRDWQKLAGSLSASNRAVFLATEQKWEQQKLAVVFRDKMSYRIAAMNREENGLIRLRELCRERYGREIAFSGRIARPGEFAQNNRLTDEDLKRIHFPVDILPD